LLDTMFDLPSLEGVEEVVISKQVIEGTAPPLYIYADRSNEVGASTKEAGATIVAPQGRSTDRAAIREEPPQYR
jgi:hypothetical protein